MKINFKNIFIVVIVLIITASLFTILSNVLNNEYYKSLIKEDSIKILNNDNEYSNIENVLKKYFSYFKNKEYNKIKDCSVFNANKFKSEYVKINNDLNLSSNYNLIIENIYEISDEIYKCEIYTTYENKSSENFIIALKINKEDKYFKILDIYRGTL